MILKTINIFLVAVIACLTLFLIEAASFRLVEPYAKWRLNLSWGSHELAKENSILKKIPLDHFALPPKKSSIQNTLSSPLEEEFDYSKKVLSFNRPVRDRFVNFISRQGNPLRRFEIVDLDLIKEVVLPGMRKPADPIDVELGLARRRGLPVGYSKGIFLYLINSGSRSDYQSEFARLESTFAFLLNQGIACVLLRTESSDEFLAKLKFLKTKFPNFSEKIFVYAEQDAVKLIDTSIPEINDLLSCLIVKDPSVEIPLGGTTSSWFMGILSKGKTNVEIANSLRKRVEQNRNHLNVYHSRLSGLLIQESKFEDLPLSSYATAYILNCLEFFRLPDLMVNDPTLNEDFDMNFTPTLADFSETNISNEYKTYLAEPNFECEVVDEYRALNSDDPKIANTSNRELVLQIGESFEEMGEDVLLQVAERDPLFYRFYLSLKEIHKSQN